MLVFKPDNINRLMDEFNKQIDPRLQTMARQLADRMWEKYRVDLMVTCIVRTPEENAAAGGLPQSSHLRKDAIDFRSSNLTEEQANYAVAFVLATWGPVMHAIYEKGGTAFHLHINLNWGYSLHNPAIV